MSYEVVSRQVGSPQYGFYVQNKGFFAPRRFFEKSILKLSGRGSFSHVTVDGAPLRGEGAFGASTSLRSQSFVKFMCVDVECCDNDNNDHLLLPTVLGGYVIVISDLNLNG